MHVTVLRTSTAFGSSPRSYRESRQNLREGGPQPWAALCGPPDKAGVVLGALWREPEGDVGIALYLGTQAVPSRVLRRWLVAFGHQDAEGVHVAGPGQLTSLLGLCMGKVGKV